MNRIAQCIYLKRLEKGLSQKALALRAGVPQPNLSRIEKGRDFKVSTLCQIAAALELTLPELLSDAPATPVNKKIFFTRRAIEKFADSIAKGTKDMPAGSRMIAKLLIPIVGGPKRYKYIRKRDAYSSWAQLKRTFTKDELSAIFSRIEKARQRAA